MPRSLVLIRRRIGSYAGLPISAQNEAGRRVFSWNFSITQCDAVGKLAGIRPVADSEGGALAAEPPTRLLKRMSPLSVYGASLVIGHGPMRLLGMTRIFSWGCGDWGDKCVSTHAKANTSVGSVRTGVTHARS